MKDKGINKPARKKEDIIKFINELDQGMMNLKILIYRRLKIF